MSYNYCYSAGEDSIFHHRVHIESFLSREVCWRCNVDFDLRFIIRVQRNLWRRDLDCPIRWHREIISIVRGLYCFPFLYVAAALNFFRAGLLIRQRVSVDWEGVNTGPVSIVS